jgi:uncharacterized protein YdaU (DUF1376 family)
MGVVLSINRTPTDFVAKTRHLSLEDRGAYQEILDQIVILGQDAEPPSLPNDDKMLANIVGLTLRRWREIKVRLCEGELAVLEIAGGRISQTRIVEEIEAARLRINSSSKAGVASGQARRKLRERMLNGRSNGRSTVVPENGTFPRTDREPVTSHESRESKTESESKASSAPPPSPPAQPAPPRKQGRAPDARTAKELVEAFTLDDSHRIWAAQNTPSVPADAELETWRDRMRANGYRTNQGPVKDPAASWRTSMKNAEKWGSYVDKRSSANGSGNGSGNRGTAAAGSPEEARRAESRKRIDGWGTRLVVGPASTD